MLHVQYIEECWPGGSDVKMTHLLIQQADQDLLCCIRMKTSPSYCKFLVWFLFILKMKLFQIHLQGGFSIGWSVSLLVTSFIMFAFKLYEYCIIGLYNSILDRQTKGQISQLTQQPPCKS